MGWGSEDKEHAMSQRSNCAIAVVGIDIGKNSFHIVAHDQRGAIVLRQKWSRGQVEARLANLTVPDRHGGLRRRASSQPQAARTSDSTTTCSPLLSISVS